MRTTDMMRQLRSRRASVAVEFALISVGFLLPLTGVAADALFLLTAQAQLNTALQALFYYALANPTVALTAATATAPYDQANQVITLINNNSNFHIILATPSGEKVSNLYYACAATDTPSTKTCTPTGSVSKEQIFLNYTVTTSVNLPLPLLGVKSPFALSASGMVEVQ